LRDRKRGKEEKEGVKKPWKGKSMLSLVRVGKKVKTTSSEVSPRGEGLGTKAKGKDLGSEMNFKATK